jgi:histone-lysine N-methyltransferase SETMAR
VIKKKRCGLLTHSVVLLHDNAQPHIGTKTQELIKTFGWEQTDNPPYNPDLAPSDFHVFLHLQKFPGGWRFLEDDNVKAVNTWFSSQAASFYKAGIQKLVPRYDQCLNNCGNYVET